MIIGVVIVAFDTGPIIVECLKSLLDCKGVDLRIAVIDNASSTDMHSVLKGGGISIHRANIDSPPSSIEPGDPLIFRASQNLGFAGGVNVGLRFLQQLEEVDAFWVLNPDTVVEGTTPQKIARGIKQNPEFDILGGRICYLSNPGIIQNDGGTVNLWTGVCTPRNMLREAKRTPVPDSNSIDYVSAAHIVVSRKFLQQAGLMPEDYFLYYEETDWCLSLEGRNMVFLDGAVAYHVGGSSIGSATIDRRASPLSTYFMAKSRLKFVWKFRPYAAPIAFVFNLLKALQLLLRGNLEGGCSSLRGTLGLPPSATVRAKMGI